jgi:hypothetical protein
VQLSHRHLLCKIKHLYISNLTLALDIWGTHDQKVTILGVTKVIDCLLDAGVAPISTCHALL